MNRMSDDLISRKALIENLMQEIPLAENVHIFRDIIENQPTAFDKEKVIDELKSAENYLYVNGARITNFKFIHPLTAIEIVEKGGIE